MQCTSISIILLTTMLSIGVSYCQQRSINHTTTLFTYLLTDYDKRLLPVVDTSQPLIINVSFSLGMIRNFDDVSGELSFLGSYYMGWVEERFLWNPRKYANMDEIVLPKEDVWYPELETPTSLNHVTMPGNTAKKVRYWSNGIAFFKSVDLLSVICSADVKQYPYDSQTCVLFTMLSGYTAKEVEFRVSNPESDQLVQTENSEWRVEKVNVESFVDAFAITIKMRRRETYIMLTLQTPIQLLGALNPWVFFLRPESGERVSFSITAFLSFTVYLGVLTEHIPRGSMPIPDVLYEVFINLIYSTAILLCTIVSLSLHLNDADKPVPAWIQVLVKLVSCSYLRRHRSIDQDTIASNDTSTFDSTDNTSNVRLHRISRQFSMQKIAELKIAELDRQRSCIDEGSQNQEQVTWSRAGKIFDRCMLAIFYIVFVTVTVIYNSNIVL